MADSDDEYERRRARDKFRRERSDYEHKRDDRRREFDHDRGPNRYESRGSWRGGRDSSGGRRDPYGRDYDNRRRERTYSPPHPKRMRRDWDDMPPYDMPHYGGGMMHRGGPSPNWGPGPNMGPPQDAGFPGPAAGMPEPDFPSQPPMQSFKVFLGQQDDTISDQDAVKKYNEYKDEFKRQQLNEFFLAHKDEEWFKSKYHPEEFGKRQEEVRAALKRRCEVYFELKRQNRLDSFSLDTEHYDAIVKILDAAVILMEGGGEEELAVLEEPEPETKSRSRNNSETVLSSPEKSSPEKKPTDKDKEEPSPDKLLEMPITAEQKELMKKAQEFSKKQQEAQNGDSEEKIKKKKRHRDKSEYSYESGSESESSSGSDSEPEPAPPGLEDEPPPPGLDMEEDMEVKPDSKEDGELDKKGDEKDVDTKNDTEVRKFKRTFLHKTSSIFLRNLPPSITKQEVEAVCKRYPGFIRVALQDAQPERRFFRRAWASYDTSVSIKEICWDLNNIRLRDCDLGAILNRDLNLRVRPVTGLTNHPRVVRQDIKHAAKIIQNFDEKWKIWDDPHEEKKDKEKDFKEVATFSIGLSVKNPVLKNITDYLVDEGSFEEEELLGTTLEEGETQDNDPEIQIETDEALNKVLDRMVSYLRIVHSIDYYSANEYPNEDEMPHRCGIMHARSSTLISKVTKKDVDNWLKNFENKVKPFVELQNSLDASAAKNMGQKDPEAEVEKFVTANTQELAKDKWLCPISGKKFKGPEFVRKHIFNKHAEKVEEVKQEVAFFNNYLLDPKRPQLQEHPGNRQGGTPGASPVAPQYPSPGAGYPPGHSPAGMMGYGQQRKPMGQGYRGGLPPPSPYQQPTSYNRREPYSGGRDRDPDTRPRGHRPYTNRRSDPRRVVDYRDWDAPDEVDIF